MRTLVPALVVVFAAAMPACAQQSCSLLTQDQVKAVAGEAVLAGKAGSDGDCSWKDAKGQEVVYLQVKDAGADYKSFRDQMRGTGRMVVVTGLAEDAFYIASSGSSAALYALKAHHLVLITVDRSGNGRAENEAAEKALMTQVLPRVKP